MKPRFPEFSGQFWGFNGTSYGPRQFRSAQAGSKQLLAYPCMPSQVCQGVLISLVRIEQVRDSIVGLIPAIGPTAITRGILLIVIDALKRHAIRAFTHIMKEIGKLAPLFTNINTSPSVVPVRWVARLSAAANHIRPRRVGWGAFPPARMTMHFITPLKYVTG